ncbi:hypothetical protein EGJ48_14990 [Pantoea dispersa]|uniref:hypothetical protein n=1 Tax=Pantoea dispersa TaxID=59814 RepID=UPI000F6744F4|nr:hypothetical protein [Pantoea dispersa]RRW70218.1 hypothetical protein EGJ48_14990 [Pantoea dispersa]
MTALNKIALFVLLGASTLSVFAKSAGRISASFDGLTYPEVAKEFISKGYSDVSISSVNNIKYLSLSSEGDVNKCSVIFRIDNDRVENTPSAGSDGKLCNISENNGNVITSRRDQGIWYNDFYRASSQGKWLLLYTDSCADCQQVKRIYYKNGVKEKEELLSGDNDYKNRKPLNGEISVQKAFLYSKPDELRKLKAYLIKGDEFSLVDMSDDGSFYQVNYKTTDGKSKLYWVKSDDFELK